MLLGIPNSQASAVASESMGAPAGKKPVFEDEVISIFRVCETDATAQGFEVELLANPDEIPVYAQPEDTEAIVEEVIRRREEARRRQG